MKPSGGAAQTMTHTKETVMESYRTQGESFYFQNTVLRKIPPFEK